MSMQKQKTYKNRKYTQAARGNECTLNSPVCNYGPETVVFCHLNESYAGKGMGKKADDFAGFDGCSACHDLYDGRNRIMDPEDDERWQMGKDWHLLRAVIRTMRNRIELGIIK